jgi:hypothetical protein
MDYLLCLIVQAVETVDARRRQRGDFAEAADAGAEPAGLEDIRRAYAEATGAWTGCDWPTVFGKSGLNLKGWTAAQARAMAQETLDPVAAADWKRAGEWLGQVERFAREAETQAQHALKQAEQGHWQEALRFAEKAWALEFSTGRPLRLGVFFTWQPLRELIEKAARN